MATSSSIIRPWLPYSIKVLVKRIKRAQTRWGCVVWSSYGHLPAPSSDPDYHIVSKYSSRNQTSPNSMGMRRLITEFLWPPSSSIIRP
ncbi:hypothetical protein EVAR_57478_1 [Eumeta japonica]|uniref:Uncharacterized protein n=1 Tax=Eumeta variegata TaxID=151549 RepID=A0A4C1ZF19_EUMVA|nr:hypothetical protein EVAR_57478_1 [Eumeta japonica]